MKILYIHHGRVLGGAPVSLLNTINGIEKYGNDEIKILFAYDDMKPFFQKNCNAEIGDIYNPCLLVGRFLIGYVNLFSFFNLLLFLRFIFEVFSFPLSVFKQYKIFVNQKPDIIHLNSSILFSSAIAAKFSGIKLVWHIREMIRGEKYNLRRILISYLIKNLSDKVVVINPAGAKTIGNSKKNNIKVIYNSINFDDYTDLSIKDDNRKQYLSGNDQKLILSLGGVSSHKGTFELLDASKYFEDNIILLIAGPPLEMSSFKESFFDNLKLIFEDILIKSKICRYKRFNYMHRVRKIYNSLNKKNVHFIGFIDSIPELISQSDLLIFSGVTPHFPRPIFEAWAMKKPVIAFDIEGVSENVDDGVDGILVKEKTGKALAETINNLIRDKEKMKEIGENGYKKSYKLFRQDVNVKKVYDLYYEILKN